MTNPPTQQDSEEEDAKGSKTFLKQQHSHDNISKDIAERSVSTSGAHKRMEEAPGSISNKEEVYYNISTTSANTFTEIIHPNNAKNHLSLPISIIGVKSRISSPLLCCNIIKDETNTVTRSGIQNTEDTHEINNDNDCSASQEVGNTSYIQSHQNLSPKHSRLISIIILYIKQMFHDLMMSLITRHIMESSGNPRAGGTHFEDKRMLPTQNIHGCSPDCGNYFDAGDENRQSRQKDEANSQPFCDESRLMVKARKYENNAAMEQIQNVFLSSSFKVKSSKLHNLVIHIEDIHLYSHPLMIDEEKYAIELKILYDDFLESKKKKKDLDISLRQDACKIVDEIEVFLRETQSYRIHEEEKNSNDSSSHFLVSKNNKMFELYKDLINLIAYLISAEIEIYSKCASVIDKWNAISSCRKIQGFQCTSIVLKKTGRRQIRRDKATLIDQLMTFVIRLDEQLICNTEAFLDGQLSTLVLDNNITRSLENELKNLSNLIGVMNKMRCAYSFKLNMRMDAGIEALNCSTAIDKNELKRRAMISSERYVARLIIDDKILHSSEEQKIDWPSWKIIFNQKFNCPLQKIPKKSCIQICQSTATHNQMRYMLFNNASVDGGNQITSSSIYLSLPTHKFNDKNGLSSFHECLPTHEKHVFNILGQQYDMHGVINITNMFWDKIYQQPDTNNSDINLYPSFDKQTGSGLGYLQGTIKNHLKLSPSLENAQLSSPEILSLNNHSMAFYFSGTKYSYCDVEKLQEPLRHSLIKQRRKLNCDKNNLKIPLCEIDISPETKGRILSAQGDSSLHIKDFVAAIQSERPLSNPKAIMEFIKTIQKFQKGGKLGMNSKITFENIIHDASRIGAAYNTEFDISNILIGLFPPRKRSLYPQQMPTKKMPTVKLLEKSRILVTIIHAYDFPLRVPYFGMINSLQPSISASAIESSFQTLAKEQEIPFFMAPSLTNSSSNRIREYYKSDNVEINNLPENGDSSMQKPDVFVQIDFCGKVYKTRSIKTTTPSWKQVIEISLPFNGENALTPQKMSEPSLAIGVTVFDIVDIDIGKGGGYYDDEITQCQEKRYIGYFNVPLTTATHNSHHAHEYLLTTPDVTFGYSHKSNNVGSKTYHHDDDGDEELQHHYATHAYQRKKYIKLSMKVVVEPPVTLQSEVPRLNLPCDENQRLILHSNDWIRRFNEANRKHIRWVLMFVICANGKEQFITRVISPQNPPPNCQASVYNCAHYVSLIPLFNNLEIMQREAINHIYFPSQHTLNFTLGNWFSHAVLLANYFLYLSGEQNGENFEVFLLFGTSVLEGQVVYVMTKCSETDKVTIWNPVTGSFFLKDDDSCPILDVCALVSRKNVYGNIQEEGKPKCTCFNIQDTRYWLPLHTRTDYEYYPLPTSDQSCHLSYTAPNQAYSLDLELEIEKALQIFFWSSRRVPTIFNSTSSESLCKMLHDLEERKFNGIAIPPSPDYYFKFTEKRSSGKQIFGFALHFTYYKTDEIVEKVKSTALHQSKHPDVEFSIAVKVFPYACNLFSAWVCILSEMPPHQCFD